MASVSKPTLIRFDWCVVGFNIQSAVFLIGLPGCGKSTAATYLENHGFVIVSAGDVIRGVCEEQGLELTRENLSNCGQQLVQEHGFGHFAEMLLARSNNAPRVVFEGIRPPEVVLWIKRKIKKSVIVFLESAEDVRLCRLSQRGEDQHSYQRAMTGPWEHNILNLRLLADKTIQNDGDLNKFFCVLQHEVLPMITE